ncbi:cation efflux family protein [Verrucomicrobiia bacterium DG1235]|nr:cation efflux family protein [Verrucomicrobiae bacterium DG1235]
MLVGFFGNSFALIADGIESLADVVSSAIVWTGVRISEKDADFEHPFGHGKAEAIAALLASVGLLVSAGIIVVNAVGEIVTPHHAPALFTVPVIVGIVIVKECLHFVLSKAAQRHDSGALKAEAWHHRSDSLTSIGVLLGVGIAVFAGPGYEFADDVAALLVTILIVLNAIRIARPALDELMDRRVEGSPVERVEKIALTLDGIEGLETVVIRRMGRELAAEIHMEVDSNMSVGDAHALSHEF